MIIDFLRVRVVGFHGIAIFLAGVSADYGLASIVAYYVASLNIGRLIAYLG